MRRPAAVLGSVVWFVLAPGVVAGLVPWWLTGWRFAPAPLGPLGPLGLGLRVVGAVLIAAGVVVLIGAFARFVVEGLGTPAPVAPPGRLVVGGLYRYVRNPMYLAVLATLVGQALLLWAPVLLGYAAVVTLVELFFVYGYEEPTLRASFGTQYDEYRRHVPAWWPRLRPWQPTDTVA
ncbi:MAG: methyltransferase family protein [Micromonosporaceae bacterium]